MRVMDRLQRYAGLEIFRVLVHHLDARPSLPHLPSGITLRIVQPNELFAAANDSDLEMSSDFVRDALAREDIAFGAFDDDRLVAYMWRTFSAGHLNRLWVRVRYPYRYGYKAFTKPSYRGKRLRSAISLFSDAYFLERGYTHGVDFILVSNFASLAAQRYWNNPAIGYAGYVKWFGRYISFRTPAVKKMGFEIFSEDHENHFSAHRAE